MIVISKRTVIYLASLALSAGSLFMLGDSLWLLAEWRVGALNGIFMLQASLLAALFFAARAQEAKAGGWLSIVK